MNSQLSTLGITTLKVHIVFTEKKNLETGLSEFKLQLINKKRITSSKYVLSRQGRGRHKRTRLKSEKKLKDNA